MLSEFSIFPAALPWIPGSASRPQDDKGAIPQT